MECGPRTRSNSRSYANALSLFLSHTLSHTVRSRPRREAITILRLAAAAAARRAPDRSRPRAPGIRSPHSRKEERCDIEGVRALRSARLGRRAAHVRRLLYYLERCAPAAERRGEARRLFGAVVARSRERFEDDVDLPRTARAARRRGATALRTTPLGRGCAEAQKKNPRLRQTSANYSSRLV